MEIKGVKMEQQNVNMQQEYEIEIDLKKVIGALLKGWYVIALAGLLAAGLMFGYTKNYIPEKYGLRKSEL